MSKAAAPSLYDRFIGGLLGQPVGGAIGNFQNGTDLTRNRSRTEFVALCSHSGTAFQNSCDLRSEIPQDNTGTAHWNFIVVLLALSRFLLSVV